GALSGPDTKDRTSALAGLTPQKRFVQVLYLNVLGRPGSDAELQPWAAMVSAPGGQAAVASGIERSLEARLRLVKTWYQTYLGRPGSNGEAMGWAAQMVGTAPKTEEQILSGILGSTEFAARAQSLISSGTAQERYVKALYLLLLDRAATPNEVASWLGSVAGGSAGVALAFLSSQEFRLYQFEGYYEALLHRPADAGHRNTWAASALDLLSVRIGIEASVEFLTAG